MLKLVSYEYEDTTFMVGTINYAVMIDFKTKEIFTSRESNPHWISMETIKEELYD